MNLNEKNIEEIKWQMTTEGCCHFTLKNGLRVTIKKFGLENNPLLLAKGKAAEEQKQAYGAKGDHGFYVATFQLKGSLAYLMLQKDHLVDICEALLTKRSLDCCWCYNLVYNQQLFKSENREWKVIWNAILKNGSPYLEAVISSPNKGC